MMWLTPQREIDEALAALPSSGAARPPALLEGLLSGGIGDVVLLTVAGLFAILSAALFEPRFARLLLSMGKLAVGVILAGLAASTVSRLPDALAGNDFAAQYVAVGAAFIAIVLTGIWLAKLFLRRPPDPPVSPDPAPLS